MLTIKELTEIAKFCHKNGISELEMGDLKLKFKPEIPRKAKKDSPDDKIEVQAPSPEDVLFWSAQ